MEKISKSIRIHVPVADVFDHLSNPVNLLEIWPSMVEVNNPVVSATGAHTFDWVYKMAGVRFHGRADTVQVERPRLIVSKNESGIPSTFRWSLQDQDGGTRLNLDVEYSLPTPVLGKLAEVVVAKMNEHEAEILLANIKHNLEATAQPRAPQPRPNASAHR